MVRNSGSDSLFVNGSAFGRDLDWLIDTGCSVTLMSTKVYYDIPASMRPKLSPYDRLLTQASGTPLQVLGTAPMTIKIGKQKLKHAIVIANCIDSGILGLDFLSEHGGQIDLKSSTIKISGREVPIHRERQQSCARIAISETVTIRAGHRMIVEAKAPRQIPSGNWLVEPLPKALAHDTLAVAKSLSGGGSDTVLMEVMNPSEADVVLYKGTQAATIETVEFLPDLRPISQTDEEASEKVCKGDAGI